MRKEYLILLFIMFLTFGVNLGSWANEPDSVYLVSYVTLKDKGRSGLHYAWSVDANKWNLIANGNPFLRCDYGSQKLINNPYLFQDASGKWQCIWSLNDTVNQFAHTSSYNLVNWSSQNYPFLKHNQSFCQPVVYYNKTTGRYTITFLSGHKYFKISTKDFSSFDSALPIPASEYKDDRISINISGDPISAKVCKVAWQLIIHLTESWQVKQFKSNQAKETLGNDSMLFNRLNKLAVSVTLDPGYIKPISDHLIGVFFEDINYSADGGLYAELLQNRDFEYAPNEKLYKDPTWNDRHSWSARGSLNFTIDTVGPLHPNNPHYAILNVTKPGGVFINSGYDGIPLKKGDQYKFSVYIKNTHPVTDELLVKLVNPNGKILAQATLYTNSTKWKKYATSLIATDDAKDANLEVQPLFTGRLMVDILSLFPKNTYKNRINGMRADLAETIAAIHPKFVRFPGGCVAHGDGLENMYRWKNTIGPIETRKPQPNIWRYHQSMGLGYFEYFQFCEDIGADPIPVIAAAVPCQNSGLLTGINGQHGGIPMNQMPQYIQDILDLVEWANGPASSRWGKLRARAGHPAPFHLKYIGIGNEDLISDVFKQRFTMIYKALRQKHPEIIIIGTAGPFHEGTDYEQGWALATKLNVPLVDEHYYESPGWFINNQDFYDNYDRHKPKVYLGEYASRGNTLFNALTEALYLISVERNGDIVQMTSYAPLLAKEKNNQWNPDLVYFNNTEVKPTVNYEIQKLFGNNVGNEYVPSSIKLSDEDPQLRKRFALSVVRNNSDGSLIVKVVNLLPVSTLLNLDLRNFNAGNKAEKSVLQGLPADKTVPVVVTSTSIANMLNEILPPFSFTLLRIHK